MDRLPARLQGALRMDPSRRERRFSDADRSTASYPTFLPIVAQNSSTSHSAMEADPSADRDSSESLQQHHCVANECAVLRTFGTTELLEIILGFLNTSDVLNLRRTCRKWNDLTQESPSLRVHYFVQPQWARHAEDFELLDLQIPGLSIEPGDEVEMGRWINVRMSARAAQQIRPNAICVRRPRALSIYEGLRGGLGSRPQQKDEWPVRSTCEGSVDVLVKTEDLLVIQPPIVGMQAFVTRPAASFASSSTTPPDEQVEGAACAKLYCEAGINLGFLAETTASLLLPNDSATVVFKAIVSFSTPTYEQRKRRAEQKITYIR